MLLHGSSTHLKNPLFQSWHSVPTVVLYARLFIFDTQSVVTTTISINWRHMSLTVSQTTGNTVVCSTMSGIASKETHSRTPPDHWCAKCLLKCPGMCWTPYYHMRWYVVKIKSYFSAFQIASIGRTRLLWWIEVQKLKRFGHFMYPSLVGDIHFSRYV